REPGGEVPRRREPGRPQAAWRAASGEHPDVEAVLQVHTAGQAHPPSKADELRAAAEEDVLAVVDLHAAQRERGGAAAEQATSLEQLDRQAGALEVHSGGQPGEPAAYDGYPRRAHDRRTSASLAPGDREARLRKGRRGSRSIMPRIR